jgi:hypothetical protein
LQAASFGAEGDWLGHGDIWKASQRTRSVSEGVPKYPSLALRGRSSTYQCPVSVGSPAFIHSSLPPA